MPQRARSRGWEAASPQDRIDNAKSFRTPASSELEMCADRKLKKWMCVMHGEQSVF